MSSIQEVVDIPAESELKTGLNRFPVWASHKLISPQKVTTARNLPQLEKSRLEMFLLSNSKNGTYFNDMRSDACQSCYKPMREYVLAQRNWWRSTIG
jgi:hypothetical protein